MQLLPSPHPFPHLGTHCFTFCRYRFVCLGHFVSMESYSMRPFVPGFPHSASCLRASPVGWRVSTGFTRGTAGVSASSLFTAESHPLLAEGIWVLSQSVGSRRRAFGSERCLSECDQRSRFSGPAVNSLSFPGSAKLVFGFVPKIRGAGLPQLPDQVLLCPCVLSP